MALLCSDFSQSKMLDAISSSSLHSVSLAKNFAMMILKNYFISAMY